MDWRKLTQVLGWCSLINCALLVLTINACVFGPDFVLDLQSSLFGIPRASVNTAMYLLIGMYKVLWLVFNIVPYVALKILEGRQRAWAPAG